MLDVADGEILLMASQRRVKKQTGSSKIPLVYDALENLLHGAVTGTSELRHVGTQGETWTLVYQKGMDIKNQ